MGRVTRSLGLSTRVALLAGVATVAVVALPFVRFAYEAPALHVALETVNAVVALVVAFLVYGRYRQSQRLQELLLVLALATVAVANLLLTAVPFAVALSEDAELSRWAPVAVRLVGTVMLAVAALTPPRVVTRSGQARRPVLLVAALVVGLSLVGLLVGDRLPPAVDPDFSPDDAARPVLAGHPAALAAQAVSGLLYGIAAVAFTRQAGRSGDELLRWVGAACVLSAFSRVHYLLFPSLYSDYVYTGDVLRLGFYLLLLVGAAREIETYWALRTRAAVLEDRRRMARDLHDGLTQELSYIWSQSRLLAAAPGDARVVDRINGAAERALDEARTAIAALTRTADGAFPAVLRQSVDGLASRYDARGVVDAPDDVVVTPERGDAILRIVTEAFRNAVRHGGASSVRVELAADPLSVVVQDDGRGFAPDAEGAGFGLTSMRERAEALGATFDVASESGKGTSVRVVWP